MSYLPSFNCLKAEYKFSMQIRAPPTPPFLYQERDKNQRGDGTGKRVHKKKTLPPNSYLPLVFPMYLPSRNLHPLEAQSLSPLSPHFSTNVSSFC